MASEATAAAPANRVFVGNIPWETDEAALRSAFEGAGSIVAVEVVVSPSGRPRGFAYVQFENAAGVQAAIEAVHGKEIAGRTWRVEAEDRTPRETTRRPRRNNAAGAGAGAGADAAPAPSSRIFLGNLPADATDDSVAAVFSSFEGFKSVNLMAGDDGACRGFGYVNFETPEQAAAGVAAAAGTSFGGQEARIELATRGTRRRRKAGGKKPAGEQKAAEPKPKIVNDPTRLFVGNLPFDTTDEQLRALFGDGFGITEAAIAVSNNGTSKGFGYVKCASEADADAAIESVQGKEVGGRPVRVEKEARKPRQRKRNNRRRAADADATAE